MKSFVYLTLCIALTMPAMAGVIVVGNPPDPGTGNCFPWGCAYNAEYQQIYGSNDFSGAVNITNLEFYNTQFNSGSTQLPAGNYTITLFVTNAVGVNTIGSSFAGNEVGAVKSAVVFSGSINQAWSFGDTLHIPIAPFAYDPSKGNLLIDVQGTNISLPGGETFFDVNSTGNFFTRVYCPSGIACTDGVVQDGYGLVTGFSFGSTAVPEPASLFLLGSGLLGLGGLARKRMKKA